MLLKMKLLCNAISKICCSSYKIEMNALINDTRMAYFSNTNQLLSGKWLRYNKIVYPPQDPSEEKKPAFICHEKKNIKYSPKKMWYVACFIRGKSVDEALKQLKYIRKKGSLAVSQTILEAQQLAIRNHNVEYKSNLWIAESFCSKGVKIRGIRRCAKGRLGRIEYKYCNYYVRLEEGTPPEKFYWSPPETGPEMLEEWLKGIRKRRITNSL